MFDIQLFKRLVYIFRWLIDIREWQAGREEEKKRDVHFAHKLLFYSS